MSRFKMNWTYPLLFALLLRITATAQSNPFIHSVPDVALNSSFTIFWEPTTGGTVTITLIGVTTSNEYVDDIAVLGANIPNSGSFTAKLGASVPWPIFTITIVSDSDPTLVSYSPIFYLLGFKSGEGDGHTASSTMTVYTTVADTSTAPPIPAPSQSHINSSTTAGAARADTTTADSSLSSESSTPSSTGLSAGAAAGVGVGATLGALILLAIAGFFWQRGRKRPFGPETSASADALETMESKSRKRASELEGTGKIPVELQGTPRAELG